ncbi:beta-lactamase family protein [Haladaptatus sp. AB618]|uniref:serine hydrolase domain-containing protein n=1 Tax=Haladaptatus sp. AB618 TaxID=2934173 RepID=UPI00209BEC69|nr:serine hydrolase domain-containing protein [Haladaptatus sp. AB618]MCO8255940.1 beta-lactamase family protein [Haladaptatus sp. AB618]
MTSPPSIHGTVAPGFEPVAETFVENFRRRDELGAACAAYLEGEKVVDLWGGFRTVACSGPWTEDTLVLVFSTTKGMAATAVAHARSNGLFEYDDTVATHWPAFGQNGKDEITIRELLAHQGGVAAPRRKLNPERIADTETLSSMLASKRPEWTPGRRHGYHSFTLGWYESELIRRTDPAGRTLGQYFADEIAAPLDAEFYVGLPDDVSRNRIAEIDGYSVAEIVTHIRQFPWRMVLSLLSPRSLSSRALDCFEIDSPADLDRPSYRSVEIPSGNGIGRVRDIAEIYGMLATDGGNLDIGTDTLDELRRPANPPRQGPEDLVLKTESAYSLGYSKPSSNFRFGRSTAAFGTPGAGGSFAFADPDEGLGFAYAPNRMKPRLWDDPRERALRNALYDCLD